MKLQNKVLGTIFGVIASSLVFIAVPVSAQAGECTAADPCMTYAEVDGSGSVVNVIVCQPSVCGPAGQFGGTLNGNRLVPQAAANPQTNDTTGTTGRMTNSVENQVVTLSNDNVFTVKKDEVIVQTIAKPEIEVQTTDTNTTITTTSIDANFGNKNFVTQIIDGVEQSVLVTNPDFVKIEATQTINSSTVLPGSVTNNTNTVKETVVFEQRKTEEEFVYYVNGSNQTLMKSKLSRISRLLGLVGWFL
jgi:hypothetical protein